MAKPVLQVIIGSTRPGRVGPAVADWIIERARARDSSSVTTWPEPGDEPTTASPDDQHR